jgi:hypothetical protein
MLSSSNGSGQRSYGIIRSGSTSAANNVIEAQMLGVAETYGGDSTETVTNANLINGKGSIQLLSSFAGTIFDRETQILNVAASAVTGSADNALISGSGGILLYGGVGASEYQIFANDFVSGSTEIGNLEPTDDGATLRVQAKGSNVALALDPESGNLSLRKNGTAHGKIDIGGSNNELHLIGGTGANPILKVKSTGIDVLNNATATSGEIKISKNGQTTNLKSQGGNTTFEFPANNGVNGYLLKTNGSGVTSWVEVLGASLARATFKTRRSISSGRTALILTGSSVDGSEDFLQINTAHDGDIATEVAALSNANMNKALEVYVNGMLLVSGSLSDIESGLADYFIVDKSILSGAFAFDLEEDDVIQLISRG